MKNIITLVVALLLILGLSARSVMAIEYQFSGDGFGVEILEQYEE